ncbi:MAG TPA: phosphatidate cytidylyltransferase [Steroidobacteraceae bacterium]|jgi:phosphatidate cytidylyltransferase|nr:phosphatidate cytidylyltransferase [Steroidobacteraceae bacterium]
MRSRLLTAFGLGLLIVLVLLFGRPLIVAGVLGAALLVGGWEWSAFLALHGAARLLYVLALVLLAALASHYTAPLGAFVHLLELAVAWWLVALAWILFAPSRASRGAAALAGVLVLVPTWLALVRIDARWAHGAQWTLFVLALAFAADTGAFFTGRRFGQLRLAPQVSPNKTWEGVLGGMLLALGVAVVANMWFELPWQAFLPLCVAAAAFSVIGDLTESLLKRHVHLKDSGRLFPGHGGVLDRIDSVTAAAPVLTLGLIWLGAGR